EGGTSSYDIRGVILSLQPDNHIPTISSDGGGDAASISVVENSSAVTTVAAIDPDVGQALAFSIVGGEDAARFTVDNTTGGLAFLTAPNFEAPSDVGGDNVYHVSVQVSDGHGGIDTQAIAISVANVNEAPNAPPSNTVTTNEDTTSAPVAIGASD